MKFSRQEKELFEQWTSKKRPKKKMCGKILTNEEVECGTLMRKCGCTYPEVAKRLNELLQDRKVSHSLVYHWCNADVILQCVMHKCCTIQGMTTELRTILRAYQQQNL